MKYRHDSTIGGKGSAPHQFTSTLRGVTVDSSDHIFVVGDSEVKVFDSSGTLLRRWQTGLPGFCITVFEEHVYVGQEGQLEIYDLPGNLQKTWRDPKLLGRVTAVQVVDDYVLIADARDRCIRRYDRDGAHLNNIGKDNRMKGFNIPNGALDFSVDEHSIIHACNPGKHRVERYTLEGDLLGHIGRFDGRDPQGFTGCCNPTNVAVTGEGHVYVTEKAGPRAKVLDHSGNLLAVIGTAVFDPNCSNMDVAVDSRGRVFVVDTVRLLINVFVAENGGASS